MALNQQIGTADPILLNLLTGAIPLQRLNLSGAATGPTLGALQTGIASQSLVAGSNDVRGGITVTSTATPPAAGSIIAVLTFGTAQGSTPFMLISTASQQNEEAGSTAVSTTGFSLFNEAALLASTTYTFNYETIL